MGRKAKNDKPFKIEYIQQVSKLTTTEKSREHGLFKKAAELAILCNTDILLATRTRDGVVTIFTSEQENSRDGAKRQLENIYRNVEDVTEYVQIFNKRNALERYEKRNIIYRDPRKITRKNALCDVKEVRTRKTNDHVSKKKKKKEENDAKNKSNNSATTDQIENQRLEAEQFRDMLEQQEARNASVLSMGEATPDAVHDAIEQNIDEIMPNFVHDRISEMDIDATQTSVETTRGLKAAFLPSTDGKMTIETTQMVQVKKIITMDIQDAISKWRTLIDKL